MFKNFVVKSVFDSNHVFANEIFSFFWGNMTSSLKKFGKSFTVASAGGYAYSEIRRGELKNVTFEGRDRANNAWAQIIQDPKRLPDSSAQEYTQVLKSSCEAVRAESRILSTEDLLKGGITSAFKSFF